MTKPTYPYHQADGESVLLSHQNRAISYLSMSEGKRGRVPHLCKVQRNSTQTNKICQVNTMLTVIAEGVQCFKIQQCIWSYLSPYHAGAFSLNSFSEAWITLMWSLANILAPKKDPTSQLLCSFSRLPFLPSRLLIFTPVVKKIIGHRNVLMYFVQTISMIWNLFEI